MPLTPAQHHFQRVTAAQQAAATADPGVGSERTQYELMLMQLAQHKRRLKEVRSTETKAELKAQLLPEYAAYIEGVLAVDEPLQDDVLTTIMVWRFDAGDIEGGLTIAAHVLKHGLTLPDQYRRNPATLVVDEVVDRELRDPNSVPTRQLQQVAELTDAHDMDDRVRAKLHKVLGLALSETNIAEALAQLERALQLDPKAGVKKPLETLQRALKRQG